MAPGYSAQCRACNSAHRGEIDKRLLSGEATRKVSAWLATEHGERIPHNALGNHKKAHLDVVAEAVARSQEAAEPAFEEAVQKTVDHMAALDRNIRRAERVSKTLVQAIQMAAGEVSVAQATLLTGLLKEVRETVKTKHEIVHGKKVDVDASVSGGLGELLALGFASEGEASEATPPAVEE